MRDSKAEFQFLDFTSHSRASRPPTLEKIGSTAATDDLDAPSMPVEYDGSVIMLGRVLCAIGVLALLAIGLATLQW